MKTNMTSLQSTRPRKSADSVLHDHVQRKHAVSCAEDDELGTGTAKNTTRTVQLHLKYYTEGSVLV